MTALILLPGMMCDARLFAPQIVALSPRKVTIAPIDAHDTMSDLAQGVLANAPPRFILGGLSMGGIVAMEILRQAPERIAGLILMDTNPLAEAAEIKARRAPQIENVRMGQLLKVMRDEMKPNYLSDQGGAQDTLDLCMDMALSLGADVFIRQSRALQNRQDQTQTLAAYKGAALILHGEDDILCPATRHTLMHSLMPQARYEIIKKAGHLPTLEQPEQTTQILKEWLSAVNL